jgi:hypothetical protein
MENITDINFWRRHFGLYPILFNQKVNDSKYLMLNGGNRDFCLQTNVSQEKQIVYFGDSWSTSTKNFLSLHNNVVYVHNWYEGKTEEYDLARIKEKPDKFYSYLSTKSYKTSLDAVPFIIDVFRQLRNLVGKKEPQEALSLLFKLLISIEEDYQYIDSSKWGILDVGVPSNFSYYVDLIRQGVNSIAPNRDLILRHIAGSLFQEAHKEVIYFDPQMDLWGGFSNKIITKNDSYSSVHYTPSYLARTIVENSLNQLDTSKVHLKIFDPACGSSEFLIETLKQLKTKNYLGKVTVIGWDSSACAISTSKFLLKYEQQTQWDSDSLKFEIRKVDDSLTEHWDNDYDLIIMNPPFMSWELLDKVSREAIVSSLGSAFKEGKPNQASAFFYKASKSLSQNGVIGCVLPSTIFTSDLYVKMRNEIKEEFTLNILAKLGNFIFENALTDVGFIVGQKSHNSILPKLIWTKNEKGTVQEALCDFRKMGLNNQPAVEQNNYSIYTPSYFPVINNSWKIISSKEDRFLKDVKRFETDGLLTTVGNIFTVKQGIRTGNNAAFVISLDEYDKIPKQEKIFYRKVINNDSIRNGTLKLVNYVWYPYNEDGIILRNEDEFKKLAPMSYERLLVYKESLSNIRARKDIKTWWYLSEHRAWLRKNQARLFSTEFGKSDSFAFDKCGDFVAERGCGWIPKKTFEIDDYYFYLAIFSSNIFDFLLSIYSKPIQSGFYLGQVYTKDIPIPNIHKMNKKESTPYNRLVELGKELEIGNSFVKYAIDDVLKSYYPNL